MFNYLWLGLVNGAIITVVALGFAIIYNTSRVFHIGYVVLYTTAPYLVYSFCTILGLSWVYGVILSILLTILLSAGMYLLIYKPLQKKQLSSNGLLVASLGVMIFGINLLALVYGDATRLLDRALDRIELVQLLVCLLVIILFLCLLHFSRLGLVLKAIRDNQDLGSVFGINKERYMLIIFGLSGLFVAIGGILKGYEFGVKPYIGMPMFLNALVALVIGGAGKFASPIIGGFIIGLLQALVAMELGDKWIDPATFGILIIFLLFRPQGIMGEKFRLV